MPPKIATSVVARLRKLGAILRLPVYRRISIAVASVYLVLFMVALQDLSLGGRGFELVTTDWSRTFERTGSVTFEPVARLTVPGLTVLISPLNLAIGAVISLLVGLNLTVTYIAFTRPKACRFNRSTGILASLPALLAGGACCGPAIVLVLGLQVSSLFMTVFQILIPVAAVLLVVTLVLALDRTEVDLLAT